MRILLFIIMLISYNLQGQTNLNYNDRDCKQYYLIMQYFEHDSLTMIAHGLKEIKLKVDTIIYNSCDELQKLVYVVQMISLNTGQELNNIKSDSIRKYWTDFKIKADSIDTKFTCSLDNEIEMNPNLLISFSRYNHEFIFVRSKTIYKTNQHSFGYNYTFKFDNNFNFAVRRIGWTE